MTCSAPSTLDVARAARILAGGQAPERDGWFVQPTLVDGLGPDHRAQRRRRPSGRWLRSSRRQTSTRRSDRQRRPLRLGDLGPWPRPRSTARRGRAARHRPDQGQRADHAASTSTPRSGARRTRATGRASRGWPRWASTRPRAPITIAAARRLTSARRRATVSSRPTQRPRMCLMWELIKVLRGGGVSGAHRLDQLVVLLGR